MMIKLIIRASSIALFVALSACSGLSNSAPESTSNPSVAESSHPMQYAPAAEQRFIAQYSKEMGLSQQEMRVALAKARYQPIIIEKMTKPAEGKPWGDYRKLLLSPRRIEAGKVFMQTHAAAFAKAKRMYGVPPEMISSILGVETFYGKNTGKFRVLDSLSTLGFGYPQRGPFFQKELAYYLKLAKLNGWEVTQLKGSYAGAFGLPQFMPSSYLHYAVGSTSNLGPDLYNPNDAILSIANYFKKNGWETGGLIAVRVSVKNNVCNILTCGKRKPLYPVSRWKRAGVTAPSWVPDAEDASLVTLQMDDGKESYLIFNNFFVITKYNISINYAMAAFDLSQALKA